MFDDLEAAKIEVETDSGLTYDVTIPDEETLAVDDVIEVTLEFEGNDANNDWFLMDVVFEGKII
jgi:hypothetical protein